MCLYLEAGVLRRQSRLDEVIMVMDWSPYEKKRHQDGVNPGERPREDAERTQHLQVRTHLLPRIHLYPDSQPPEPVTNTPHSHDALLGQPLQSNTWGENVTFEESPGDLSLLKISQRKTENKEERLLTGKVTRQNTGHQVR